jgi:hypothetical protein
MQHVLAHQAVSAPIRMASNREVRLLIDFTEPRQGEGIWPDMTPDVFTETTKN